ncbi:helix-turn-helix transcriptional regulator [Saccharothrix syringae]|uniref:LuxR family transcriptional regulator n=1 Tax=Saccharothrix syringae TaxID=103733 RepID=A0A5Q0H1T0_SACSY|nr:helix-turn-helix transcriptional regulator [Saccharothrix syringae]QFZ20158.1 LuxR family transcriptional regulator [Saccharothrix syringae]
MEQLDVVQAEPATARGGHAGTRLVTDEAEISRLRGDLVRDARRECRWVTAHDGSTPAVDRAGPAGVRRRGICTRSAIEHDEVGASIARAVANGEEYRLTREQPPTGLLIADDVVLLCLAGAPGAVLVRAPRAVSVLVDYFERLWAGAVPLGDDRDCGTALPAMQSRILRLAAQGLKDESIARVLGLSARSVRRHMEKLAERAGASNRLTLGIAAARLGWI